MSKKEFNVEEIEVVESEEAAEERKANWFTKTWGFVKEKSKKIPAKKIVIEAGKAIAFTVFGAVVGVKLASVVEYEDAYEDEGLEFYDEEDSVASDDVTE